MTAHLNTPYGGTLIDGLVSPQRQEILQRDSREWLSWDLTPRQLCDLELLLNGAFSPLSGFMRQPDYEAVCHEMRLAGGGLWPVPIVLDVSEELAAKVGVGESVALRDAEGVMLAALQVEDTWKPNKLEEAALVYGTSNPEHPGVRTLLQHTNPWYLGGRIEGLQLPGHYDFKFLRHTPRELRDLFARMGWRRVVAFQTRNPMHRAHYELTVRAATAANAGILIHPAVGMTRPGDLDHYTRVRCYQAVMHRYTPGTATLSLLPLAMRMAGPRETLLHAIIRRNYGCTHMIVGRDHAGLGRDLNGCSFYGPYAAQETFARHADEIGVAMMPFAELVYSPDRDAFVAADEVPPGTETRSISGAELRERLADGREIPSWSSFPEVIRELRRTHPPRHRQGFTVFFTGLSGAGKSTIANVLMIRLLEMGGRPVTLWDGDIVRTHLSSELGFSKEHRDINIRRIGFVASENTKNGAIAICAPIAPYDAVRKEVRSMIQARGGFILVYVSTPLEVCERRDRKGLYAKARAGSIQGFTGISDPYQ
ncbi:bifunctional sulfate adenylyltransferase/adenylylsulfate kinase, partial [Candidatus Fermentibacteria bacterium]|nr:bifunctional sulfate adenylyltransferase/adenylylsulfate kinase [Candidatus Fermentibacteria bacterium]